MRIQPYATTIDEFKQKGVLNSSTGDIYGVPPFSTPSGKIEISSETLKKGDPRSAADLDGANGGAERGNLPPASRACGPAHQHQHPEQRLADTCGSRKTRYGLTQCGRRA